MKTAGLICLLFLLMNNLVFSDLPKPRLLILPASLDAGPNSVAILEITAENVVKLSGAEVHLSFDKVLLSVEEVGPGPFLAGGEVLQNRFDNLNGTIDYAVAKMSGSASGTGSLISIKFRTGESTGTARVQFVFDPKNNRDTDLLDEAGRSIDFTIRNSKIIVEDFGRLVGVIKLDCGHERYLCTEDISVQIEETGQTTKTDGQANFNFYEILDGSYTVTARAAGSSTVELADVYVASGATTTLNLTLLAGDGNNDGKINLSDFYVLRDAFGSLLEQENWQAEADFDHDDQVNLADFSILVANFGRIQQVSKVSVPFLTRRAATIEGARTTAGIGLYPANLKLVPGKTFTMEVKVENVSELNGLEFHLAFNPDLAEIVDDNAGIAGCQIKQGSLVENWPVLINQADNNRGKIDYAVGKLDGAVSGGGTVAVIQLRAKAAVESRLIFERDETNNRKTCLAFRNSSQVFTPNIINEAANFSESALDEAVCYPNPVRGKQTVKFAGIKGSAKIKIYNLSGELIYQQENFEQNPLWDLKNQAGETVASGIYIWRLEDEKGTKHGRLGVIK
ncbi:MAG: cohesin domain-containing protein [Elusimicrobiota bacterium]